jgi:PhnB protein
MSTSKVKAIPEGMHSLTPHLVCAGAANAIEFYKKAFDAVELMRLPGKDGKLIHGAVRIGNSVLMLVDEMPQWNTLGPNALKGTPVTIHHCVEDADAAMAQAVAAGATVTMPLADMFWGDRYGQVKDPFGHSWSIAAHIRDMTPEQIQEEMMKMPMPS